MTRYRRIITILLWTWGSIAWASVSMADGPRVESSLGVSTFRPVAGEEVRIELDLATGEDWRRANIGRLIARAGARQWTIPAAPRSGETFLRVRFDDPGPVLLVLSAGGEAEKGRSDSWRRTTYCTKVVFDVGGGDEDGAVSVSGGITGKVGERVEVLPLVDPTRIGVGDDLPVRVYYEGHKLVDTAVSSYARGGDSGSGDPRSTKRSDSAGMAWFKIDRVGHWLIRFEHMAEGVRYVGELRFEVAAGTGGAK